MRKPQEHETVYNRDKVGGIEPMTRGVVVHLYPGGNACTVEFFDKDGNTITVETMKNEDLVFQYGRELVIRELIDDMVLSMADGKFCRGVARDGFQGYNNMTNAELERAYEEALGTRIVVINPVTGEH